MLHVMYFFFTFAPSLSLLFFFFNDTATTEIYTLSLHDALPIYPAPGWKKRVRFDAPMLKLCQLMIARSVRWLMSSVAGFGCVRSEEHTSELQSRLHLVCRLLLEKKKKKVPQTSCRLTS